MKTEDLGNSKILNLIFKPAGVLMGSKVRQWIFDPFKTLRGADIQSGQTILEVGCGTGFFTIPAAKLIGDQGCLVAMDVSSGFIEQLSKKVQNALVRAGNIISAQIMFRGLIRIYYYLPKIELRTAASIPGFGCHR